MPINPTKADCEQLGAVDAALALRFRRVFDSAGYGRKSSQLGPRSRGGENLPRLLRLTRGATPTDTQVRLFLLGYPVDLAAARSALQPVPLEEWIEAGMIEVSGDQVRARVTISTFDDFLLAIDPTEMLEHGADADFVSGYTNSTLALAAFAVRRPCRRVLDLGTGCGLLAFLASRFSERVWATDLNPRAIQFARFNALLNSISNVEFLCGSAFVPVMGMKFDLVLTNPPCIIGPRNRYAFRDSGEELDNLSSRLVAAAPDFLNEGGFFQSTTQWPNLEGHDWKDRLAGWLAESCDALVLRMHTSSPMDQAEETITDTEALDAEARDRLFHENVDYFERMGVESLSSGLIALRRRAGVNWMKFEDLPPRGVDPFGEGILRLFEAGDASQRTTDAMLLSQKLHVVPGLVFESSFEWTGDTWSSGDYTLRQPLGCHFQAKLDGHMAGIVRRCDGKTPLIQILRDLAERLNVEVSRIEPGGLALIRRMVEDGFLMVEAA